MLFNFKDTTILYGVLLLLITISSNFVVQTFSCKLKQFLENNQISKHIILLLTINFLININDGKNIHPIDKLKSTFLIWIGFLIFSKINLYYIFAIFALLLILYVMHDFKNYYKSKNIINQDIINKFNIYANIITITMFIILIIGLIKYLIKQKKDHKNFDYIKFFLGTTKCNYQK